MPKEKRSKKEGSSTSKITDPRFKNFEEDPRFRLPSKRSTKIKLDERFSGILKDEDGDFTSIAKVDRYGRKLKHDKKKKALKRLYAAGEDDDESASEIDDDDIVQRELDAANKKYDPARHGGYASSSDESSDEDEEQDDSVTAGLEKFQDEQVEVETGEVTSRFAVVNLDWDHVTSNDLFALFHSFLAATGRIVRVSIYPSSFGKERMDREELEGPPKEIFKKKGDDEADEDDKSDISDEEVKNQLIQEGEEEDFDNDALRTYQLERLRYYFAVVECSDAATAKALYDKVDGTEYLSSSNFMDLRFVPDDLTFDEEPRETATEIPSGYKPVDFVTDALFNSKVKLSWDVRQDEGSRNESMQKAFSGSRSEIAENDLQAYLASDASDSDEDDYEPIQKEETANEGTEGEPQLSKKELARRKMRAALGLSDEPLPKSSKSGPVGDMQITFTSALSEKDSKKKKNPEEETTLDKYKRKEAERKARKQERRLARREGVDLDTEKAPEPAEPTEPVEDLGFDDPFFTSEAPAQPTKSSIRKEERLKKRAAKEKEAAESAAERAHLELIMANNANDENPHLDHFDMNEILRVEKEKKKAKKGKKGKGKKSGEERGGLQEDFKLNTGDSRFQAVFHEHEFAIDPSNPRYKETTNMKKLLEEGRNKRKAGAEDEDSPKRSSKKTKGVNDELSGLISAVKKKSGKR